MSGGKLDQVLSKLKWMKDEKIWPNGLRYLWTDAHGVCALLSLYHETKVNTIFLIKIMVGCDFGFRCVVASWTHKCLFHI